MPSKGTILSLPVQSNWVLYTQGLSQALGIVRKKKKNHVTLPPPSSFQQTPPLLHRIQPIKSVAYISGGLLGKYQPLFRFFFHTYLAHIVDPIWPDVKK